MRDKARQIEEEDDGMPLEVTLAQRAAAERRLQQCSGMRMYPAVVRRHLLKLMHPQQFVAWQCVDQGEQYVSLCCGRRAGKTRFLAMLIILLLGRARFGEEVVFVAPTLKRGKELIWQELVRLNDAYRLGYQLTENRGTMLTRTRAMFRIVGLDNQRQIGKIARGGNTLAFLADECQEFAHLLQKLVDAASPALAQRKGVFIASGTPGFVRRGYWYDVCHGGDGFRTIHWTLFDNPYLGRDAREIIEEEKKKKGWGDRHPTLLREYFGQWIDDETRLVCEFNQALNLLHAPPPTYSRETWRHVIGVDYGHSPDPCAWVVLAAHPYENQVVVVHAEKQYRLTSDQIATRTNELRELYHARRIVGDSASGGKTFIADFNVRYGRVAGIAMMAADKVDKAGSIDMVNTELRTGRLAVLAGAGDPLVSEMLELQWDEDFDDFVPGAEDHLYDALRYGLRALRAFLTKKEKRPETEEERELQRVIARNKRAAHSRPEFLE